jgi:hypothetical protein
MKQAIHMQRIHQRWKFKGWNLPFHNNNIRLMIKLDKTRETLKFEVNIQETIYKVTVFSADPNLSRTPHGRTFRLARISRI